MFLAPFFNFLLLNRNFNQILTDEISFLLSKAKTVQTVFGNVVFQNWPVFLMNIATPTFEFVENAAVFLLKTNKFCSVVNLDFCLDSVLKKQINVFENRIVLSLHVFVSDLIKQFVVFLCQKDVLWFLAVCHHFLNVICDWFCF